MKSLRLVQFSLAGLAVAAALAVVLPAHPLEALGQWLDDRSAPLHREMPVFARADAEDAGFVSAEFSPTDLPAGASHITLI
jgi:hypothetical protein